MLNLTLFVLRLPNSMDNLLRHLKQGSQTGAIGHYPPPQPATVFAGVSCARLARPLSSVRPSTPDRYAHLPR